MVAGLFLSSLLGFSAFGSVLQFPFFTATDTLTLIDTARVESINDIVRIASQPLMGGTTFTDVGLFWRPISTFSFAVDYWVWGLKPFGYHLTNLLLHVFATSLVILLFYELADRDPKLACFAGVIFCLHPLLVDVVPADARRQDIIGSVFMLLSLLLFVRSLSQEKLRWAFYCLSILSYATGLLAKETVIILPCLIWGYCFWFSNRCCQRTGMGKSLGLVVPYLVTTILYLGARFLVLSGLGGYAGNELFTFKTFDRLSGVASTFYRALFYPADFFQFCVGMATEFWTGIALLATAILMTLAHLRARPGSKPFLMYTWYWQLLLVVVLTFGGALARRSLYQALVPFSAFLSCLFVQNFPSLRQKKTGHGFVQLVIFSFASFFAATLIFGSPLFRSYKEWECSAKFSRQFLEEVGQRFGEFPKEGSLLISGLPQRIESFHSDPFSPKEVSYFHNWTIKSWLNLLFPRNRLKIVLANQKAWQVCDDRPTIDKYHLYDSNFLLLVSGHGTDQYPTYSFGEVLNFNTDLVNQWLCGGWSGREDWGRWTDGDWAGLKFGLGPFSTHDEYCMRIDGNIFLPSKQAVRVHVNGTEIGEIGGGPTDQEPFTLRLPGSLLRARNLMQFQVISPVSPKNIGMSLDSRKLGLGVRRIVINNGACGHDHSSSK